MLHDARRTLAADHALVHRMGTIALDIFDGTVLEINFDPATAGAHVAGGGLDLVPGLERGVDLGLGHGSPGVAAMANYMMGPGSAIGPIHADSRHQRLRFAAK